MELVADDEQILRKIVTLFKNEGEVLLSDAGKLTLPVTALSFINRAFESVQDSDFESSFEATPANTTKLPHYHEVQILYDFIQKLSRLKVSHRFNNPVAIDVTPFRSLKHLEIKRIPIHLVNGISKVQGHLESISCTRCIASLQELFEQSGGDKSSAMSWSDLQAAYLRENRIRALDPSLRLTPLVKILDLSCNAIEETMNYLEYLTELMVLNLNCNKISKIPCLSVTCKARLQVLLLKYNQLSHLDGIQELRNLQELDVRGNLIASHTLLLPLKPLAKLRLLKLESNPICYHGEHRKRTIQQIHPTAVSVVLLDGKPFSKKEQKNCSYSVPSVILPPSRRDLLVNGSDMEESMEQSLVMNYEGSVSVTTQSESEIQVTSIRTDRKKKTGKRGKSLKKARNPDISDMDSVTWETESVDATSFKSFGLEDEEHQLLKEKVEKMRTELGSDWLQAQKVSQGQTSRTGYSSEIKPQASAVAGSSPNTSDHGQTTEAIIESTTSGETDREKELSQGSFRSIKSFPNSPKSVSTETVEPEAQKPPERITRQKSSEQESLLWKSSGSETMLADFGAESEPFIVSSEDDPDESYIVTIAEKFILEKDINGTVTEQLDLSCLIQATVYECGSDVVHILATGGATAFCVKLKLNYINKSKQERRYIMEDEASAQAMCDLLQPVVNANKLLAMAKDRLQCLKCGHEFNKNTAKRHVKKSSFGGMPKSSSIGQQLVKYSNSLADKGTLEEALTCPQCSSDMIIELDPKELAKPKDVNTGPPVSPIKLGFPLATSSAQSSPQKPVNSSRHSKQSDGVAIAKKNLENHPAYSAEASFQSCLTESSSSFKSTSREDYQLSRKDPEPSNSYKSIAKTMRATLTSKVLDKNSGNMGNPHALSTSTGAKNKSETAERESETGGFPQMKLSNTKAWVESNPSEVGLLAAKSNSSTGVLSRISHIHQGAKSTSDTQVLEGGLSGSNTLLSQEHFTDSRGNFESSVFRRSGSDILVLNGSSKEDTQSSSEIFVDATNADHSPTRVLRPSGSDLLILKDSSAKTQQPQSLSQTDSNHLVQNSYSTKPSNLLGIVDPYCGQISLAGQLSRRRTGSKESGRTADDPSHREEEDLDISMSESEPDSLMTTSELYFSAKSSPKKTVRGDRMTGGTGSGSNRNDLDSSEELDKSNPFYESADELDKGDTFYEGSRTPMAGDSDVLEKSNPFYEEDIEVLDSTDGLSAVSENKETRSRSGSHVTKMKLEKGASHNTVGSEVTLSSAGRISSQKTLTRKLSSDIEVLTEGSASPCDTVIRQNESESHLLGNPQQNETSEDPLQLSPVGSLTDRTINDMLDFMRNSIYDSPRDNEEREELESLIYQRNQKKGKQSPRQNPKEELIQYNYEDFSAIDHRLKLYLMMNVFGSDEEEFQLLLKCGVLQYTKSDEVEGILVASNLKLYIFRIVNKEKPEHIDKWLKLVHSQHLSELHYLDIGLGYQSFRMEFGLEATCFDLLIREELRCKTFVAQFTALLQDTTFNSQSHLAGISKNNPVSLENLEKQVILFSSDSVTLDPSEVDVQVVRFLKGFLYQTKAQKSPVSLVITRSHICLASENHKFPPPRCSQEKVRDSSKGHAEVRVQQFSFKDRQRVTDLTRVEVFKEDISDAILYFMDDSSPDEFKWVISMTTKRSLGLLLESLRHVWTEHFGVDLQITSLSPAT